MKDFVKISTPNRLIMLILNDLLWDSFVNEVSTSNKRESVCMIQICIQPNKQLQNCVARKDSR